ncbi:MAG: hypothetical protein ACM34I_00630 [bacterium]
MHLHLSTRAVTQILLGLMLFFGAGALLLKALMHGKAGRYQKGIWYGVIGAGSLLLSIVAFGMASLELFP